MTRALEVALRLVQKACCPKHVEEIEGDLLEAHRRCVGSGHRGADLLVLKEAFFLIVRCPSGTLLKQLRRLTLVSCAVGALLAYVVVFRSASGSFYIGWQLVVVGTLCELLFWVLLLNEGRARA